jgi:hypothetical protein
MVMRGKFALWEGVFEGRDASWLSLVMKQGTQIDTKREGDFLYLRRDEMG